MIPQLRVYDHTEIGPPMFTAALRVTGKTWKQPESLKGFMVNTPWHVHARERQSATKKHRIDSPNHPVRKELRSV